MIAAYLAGQRDIEQPGTATEGEPPGLAAGSPIKGGPYADMFYDGADRVLHDLPIS